NSTLTIILLLAPGLCFSTFYLKGIKEYSKAEDYKLISLHTVLAIIYTTFLLLIFYGLSIVLNSTLHHEFEYIRGNTNINFLTLLIYFSTFIIAILAGKYLSDNEIFYEYLTPVTYWNTLFAESKKEDIDAIITLTIEVGKEVYLYIGTLDNFQTKRDELDYIILKRPYRRKLKNDEEKLYKEFSERFYRIDVDKLVIDYSKISSLGIKIISVKENK
ncbi:TPA: hypothetical protein U0P89_002916, partial [Legionella pneumophila]|nr:hypothetical protein [Legionella pneumophila]